MRRIVLCLFSVLIICSVCLSAVPVKAQESLVPPALRKTNDARVAKDIQSAPSPWNNAASVYYVVPAISPVKRLPGAYPGDGKFLGTLEFTAALGEFEPASFVAYASNGVKKLELKSSALRNGKASISPDAVDIKIVKVWYQEGSAWYGFYADPTQRVAVPELLLNDDSLIKVDHATQDNFVRYTRLDGSTRYTWMSFGPTAVNYTNIGQPEPSLIEDSPSLRPTILAPGEFKQFFVTIKVPQDATPGIYTGNITLTADGKEAGVVPISLRVLPFKLPRAATYYNPAKEFYGSMYVQSLGDYSDAALKNLADHNILNPMMERGFQALNEDEFARMIHRMKEAGLSTRPLFGAGVYARVLADTPPTPKQQQQLDELKTEATKAMAIAEKYLGHKEVYMYGYDEGGISRIRKERAAWRIVHEAGGKTMVSTYPHGSLVFNLDFMVMPGMPLEHKKEIVDRTHAANPDSLVAWYADPHTGPENPDYARRIYGVMSYKSNYDAVCNYVWERNDWNDFWIPREPNLRGLGLVYSSKNGVIDTLAWEGVREGLDDIRYATKLKQLATQALKSANVDINSAGRRALSWLTYWDAYRDDLTAGRLEMITHILELHGMLKPHDASNAQPSVDTTNKQIATEPSDKIDADAQKLMASPATGDSLKSLKAIASSEAKQNIKGANALLQMALKKMELTVEQRLELLHHQLLLDLRYDAYEECKLVLDAYLKETANLDVKIKSLSDQLTRWRFDSTLVSYGIKAIKADDFKAAKMAYQRSIELSSKNIHAYFGLAEAAMALKDNKTAESALQYILDYAKWPAKERYAAAVVKLALTSKDSTTFRQHIGQVDKEFAKDAFTTEQRYVNLNSAALVLFKGCRYDDVRALQTETAAMMRPEQEKQFVLHYAKDAPNSADSWSRSPLLQDSRYRESRFERYATVSLYNPKKHDLTKLKGVVDTTPRNKEGYDTNVYLAYDEKGVYIYVQCDNPEALQVSQGLVDGGTLEMYLQPGKDQAYHQWWFKLPGTTQQQTVDWDTPHRHYRYTGDYIVKSTTARDGKIGACTFIPWLMVYDALPSASNAWVFSVQRFTKNASVTLGGSVHELGRALKLKFDMTKEQSLAIKRDIISRAYAKYLTDRKAAVDFWEDLEAGDPQFYKSIIAPLFEQLDKAGEQVKPGNKLSDSAVEELFEKFVPAWLELSYEISDRRSAYLEKQFLSAKVTTEGSK